MSRDGDGEDREKSVFLFWHIGRKGGWNLFYCKHCSVHFVGLASLIRKKSETTQNYHFSEEAIFLIRVLKIEESETSNTYVGKKGILHT
jgi:hypothetical protein